MQRKEIIVVGASSGGIEALKELVAGLPADFTAAVLIVLHVAPYSLGILPEILERAGPLPAANARDRESIAPGRIYVAPPDHHLLVEQSGYVRVTRGSYSKCPAKPATSPPARGINRTRPRRERLTGRGGLKSFRHSVRRGLQGSACLRRRAASR